MLPVALKVIADLCLIPIGTGVSLSPYIAAAYEELQKAGLKCRLHAYGTNIEGEYDAVFRAIKRGLERVHAMGAPRVSCSIKLGTRTDREQGMDEKVASVEALLKDS